MQSGSYAFPPNDVRTAFKAYISSATYYNREQLSYDKWGRIYIILQNPAAFRVTDKEAKALKHRAQSDFELIGNKLYRKSNIRYSNARYVVRKAEVFGFIAEEHLKLLHAGRNKASLPYILESTL